MTRWILAALVSLGLLLACEVQYDPPLAGGRDPAVADAGGSDAAVGDASVAPDAGSWTSADSDFWTVRAVVRREYLYGPPSAPHQEILPIPAEQLQPEAYWIADGGSFVRAPVTYVDGGVLRFDVPRGARYYLQSFAASWVHGQAAFVDLSLRSLGRPGASYGTIQSVALDGGGLAPWERFNDSLQVYSPDVNGSYSPFISSAWSTCPKGGSTSAACQKTSGSFTRLASVGPTDRAYLFQLRSIQNAEGVTGSRVVGIAAVSLTVDAGQLYVPFQMSSPMTTVRFGFAHSQFAPIATAVHPEARYVGGHGWVGVNFLGRRGVRLPLLSATIPTGVAGPTTLTYADGLPDAKQLSLDARFEVPVRHAGLAGSIGASVSVQGSKSLLDGMLAEPILLPPGDLQIEGAPGTRAGIMSLTPELRWSPPIEAAQLGYSVTWFEVAESGGFFSLRVKGTLRTSVPEARIPPGALAPGAAYVFSVRAHLAETIRPTPNGPPGWIERAADTISGVWTTQP